MNNRPNPFVISLAAGLTALSGCEKKEQPTQDKIVQERIADTRKHLQFDRTNESFDSFIAQGPPPGMKYNVKEKKFYFEGDEQNRMPRIEDPLVRAEAILEEQEAKKRAAIQRILMMLDSEIIDHDWVLLEEALGEKVTGTLRGRVDGVRGQYEELKKLREKIEEMNNEIIETLTSELEHATPETKALLQKKLDTIQDYLKSRKDPNALDVEPLFILI